MPQLPASNCNGSQQLNLSSSLTHSLADSSLTPLTVKSQELLYDWRFTANQFILEPSPLRPTTRVFSPLNPRGHSSYVTSSLTRGWICLLWIGFAFVKCAYRTHSIGLHGYGECLFLPGSSQSHKSDNSEWRTSHGVWDVFLRSYKSCSCLLSSESRLQLPFALNSMNLSGLWTLAAILLY
jgi:hypothetical protein